VGVEAKVEIEPKPRMETLEVTLNTVEAEAAQEEPVTRI